MLTKPFKPLALAFLVNLIISVEDKIKYKINTYILSHVVFVVIKKTSLVVSFLIIIILQQY